MFLLISIAVIYIMSVLIVRKFNKLTYSSLGRWSNLEHIASDYIFMILPVANTIAAFMMLFEPPLRNNDKTFFEILIKR